MLFIIFSLVMGCAATGERAPHKVGTGEKDCHEIRGLIVLTEFPDVRHSIDRRYAVKRFFQELNSYVQEMSYGKYCIGGDVTSRWYKLPNPVAFYKISPRNLEVDKSRVSRLIQEALAEAERDYSVSDYSFIAIFMGAQRTEYGMIGLCGYPGMLGWSTADVLKTKKGQVIRGGVAIFSYQAHLGTLFHDVAHILGGVKDGKRMVPCLYDHDLQARPGPLRQVFEGAIINMGFWDPMSCHYYKWEEPPTGISSWTKMRLNWIDSKKIRVVKPAEKTQIVLGPLEERTSETLVIKVPFSQSAYYLIENRQPIGFDRYLPGNGVLIMYADDRVAECRQGKSPVKLMNVNPAAPNLKGAAFDVGPKNTFVDEKNGIKIQILGKVGKSYKILIGPHRE